MKTIIPRGPGGVGKTTLGETLRAELGYPSALIDTDMFNWETVPGESNKQVVYDAVRTLAEVYLRNGYNVIVCGLILTSEDHGGIALLASATRFYGHSFHDFYCSADLATALERSNARSRDIPEADIKRWWSAAEVDVINIPWPVHRLDMTRSIPDLVIDVLHITGSSKRTG